MIDGEWCHVLDEFYDDYLSFMSKNSMGTERDFSKAKCRILCANISVVGHATVENRLSVKGELGLTTDELKSISAKLNTESLESRKMHAKRRAVEKELNFGKALKRRKADPTGVVASLLARVESNVQTKIHKAEEKARKAAVAADKKEKQDKRRIALCAKCGLTNYLRHPSGGCATVLAQVAAATALQEAPPPGGAPATEEAAARAEDSADMPEEAAPYVEEAVAPEEEEAVPEEAAMQEEAAPREEAAMREEAAAEPGNTEGKHGRDINVGDTASPPRRRANRGPRLDYANPRKLYQ